MSNKTSKSNNITKRINEITEAWSIHAPEAKFASMTLMEFQAAINPPLDLRTKMKEARRDLKGKVAQKMTADNSARELLRRVVDTVIADPNYGPNSPLYRAMDYVTRDERKSGLTRKSAAVSPTPATEPTDSSAPTPTTTAGITASSAPAAKA